ASGVSRVPGLALPCWRKVSGPCAHNASRMRCAASGCREAPLRPYCKRLRA
ncbi:unnamed protein product, partial [Symbiodinium natans]